MNNYFLLSQSTNFRIVLKFSSENVQYIIGYLRIIEFIDIYRFCNWKKFCSSFITLNMNINLHLKTNTIKMQLLSIIDCQFHIIDNCFNMFGFILAIQIIF